MKEEIRKTFNKFYNVIDQKKHPIRYLLYLMFCSAIVGLIGSLFV
ncbi:hypothetical protein R4B61_00490 [Fructilactobacillus vespulae]